MRSPLRGSRVLALGSGLTLLGVIRALSQTGADVIALPDTTGAPRKSRWFRAGPSSLLAVLPSSLEQALETLATPTVVIPCSDLWVRSVAGLSAETRRRYPISVAPVDVVDIMVDKNRFRETLARLGLPHPTTHILRSPKDLDGVPESILRSSFLKPVRSQEFFAHFGVKAFRIGGGVEARCALERCMAAGFDMMLQEYIPGPPTNHYFIDGFVDRDGIVKARFARRRLRMSPPDFGNSTMMESVPLVDVGSGSDTLDTLFAFLRYRGIFSAEFKRDERDGAFNLIEVNARPWWYVEFAARCGVNVCELAVRDALGDEVEPIAHYAVGRRCVFPYYDVNALRARVPAAGRLSFLTGLRSWLGAYQPVFRWSDPLPSVSEMGMLVRRRF